MRRFGHLLKLDIARFCSSLQYEVVLAMLHRLIKDAKALALCKTIVCACDAAGHGLPIGHLTSQWFANLVLDRLDHALVEDLRVPGYVRYMDDLVVFADDPGLLRNVHDEIRERLRAQGLALKERVTLLAPCRVGLPFLGWQVHRRVLRLRQENLRRTKARLRHRHWQHRHGILSEETLAECTRAVVAHLKAGNTLALRRRLFGAQLREQAAGSGNRVNRGGSFDYPAANARSANRNRNTEANRNNNLGLRPAKTPHSPDANVASGTFVQCTVMSRLASRVGRIPTQE